MTHKTYRANAIYDRRTDSYFGRVTEHVAGKCIQYAVIRRPRPCKSEAMDDAYRVALDAIRNQKINLTVVENLI